MTLSHADLRHMYKTMLLIRRFEEQAVAFFLSGELRGSLHPCIGQEATAVGACHAAAPRRLPDLHLPRPRPGHRQGAGPERRAWPSCWAGAPVAARARAARCTTPT